VSADVLTGEFEVPRVLRGASFGSFVPRDAAQATARAAVEEWVREVVRTRQEGPRRWRRRQRVGTGLYLDGAFGVGKSHLAAAAVGAVGEGARFVAFGDLTAIVGAAGLEGTRALLAAAPLVVIDEFELDDPGDTVMVSRLVGELMDAGCHVLATSNTLPDRLGQGRFAAEDFAREIGRLAARFRVVTVPGSDWRRRDFGELELAEPLVPRRVREDLEVVSAGRLVDDLARVHPVRYRSALRGRAGLLVRGPLVLADQDAALRFVALVDRAWEEDVALVLAETPLGALYRESWLRGGYRKRYGRSLSRLVALALRGGRDGDLEASGRAGGGAGADLESAAELAGPRGEVREPVAKGRGGGVEANPVVGDGDGDRPSRR